MSRAGEFRHRVTIQRDVLSDPSDTGERTKSYVEFARPWADVRTLGGREDERTRSIAASVTHTVRIRYMADLAKPEALAYRVLWEGRTLWINAVVDDENRKREQMLYCTEDVSEDET